VQSVRGSQNHYLNSRTHHINTYFHNPLFDQQHVRCKRGSRSDTLWFSFIRNDQQLLFKSDRRKRLRRLWCPNHLEHLLRLTEHNGHDTPGLGHSRGGGMDIWNR
jgi:hypothetical protein